MGKLTDSAFGAFCKVYYLALTSILVAAISWVFGLNDQWAPPLIGAANALDFFRYREREKARFSLRVENPPPAAASTTPVTKVKVTWIWLSIVIPLFLAWMFFPVLPERAIDWVGPIFGGVYRNYIAMMGVPQPHPGRAQMAALLAALTGFASLVVVFRELIRDLDQVLVLKSAAAIDKFTSRGWWVLAFPVLLFLSASLLINHSPLSEDGSVSRYSPDRNFHEVLGIALTPVMFWFLAAWGFLIKANMHRLRQGQGAAISAHEDNTSTPTPIPPRVLIFLLLILVAGLSHFLPAKAHRHEIPDGSSYGAIAYSQTDESLGFSVRKSTQNAAEMAALRTCRASAADPADCRVNLWFRNACGAIAKSENGAFGTAWGMNPYAAAQAAIKVCTSYNGTDCRVLRLACSFKTEQHPSRLPHPPPLTKEKLAFQ